MNRKIEFKSNKAKNKLKEEIILYFLPQGFKMTSNETSSIQFERGSVYRNMITFNPLKWKSTVDININKTDIIAKFEINTIFQAITIEEEELWEEFISNFRKTIETGQSTIPENIAKLKATKKSTFQYIKHTILGALIFGIPSGIIAYLTGINILVSVGAASGALYFMLNKIDNDKLDKLETDKKEVNQKSQLD